MGRLNTRETQIMTFTHTFGTTALGAGSTLTVLGVSAEKPAHVFDYQVFTVIHTPAEGESVTLRQYPINPALVGDCYAALARAEGYAEGYADAWAAGQIEAGTFGGVEDDAPEAAPVAKFQAGSLVTLIGNGVTYYVIKSDTTESRRAGNFVYLIRDFAEGEEKLVHESELALLYTRDQALDTDNVVTITVPDTNIEIYLRALRSADKFVNKYRTTAGVDVKVLGSPKTYMFNCHTRNDRAERYVIYAGSSQPVA